VPTVGEIWLHEWLHGVCDYYSGKGYRMPDGCADGGGRHGYMWSPSSGWAAYYRDLMTGRVQENGVSTGISPDMWRSGSILGRRSLVLADYFHSDTTARYQRVGTVAWKTVPAKEQYIALGSPTAGHNAMYIPVHLLDDFTVTGRLYIPAIGVGSWDSVAIALRNDQVEYWTTLAYGLSLVERNHISIMRNDR